MATAAMAKLAASRTNASMVPMSATVMPASAGPISPSSWLVAWNRPFAAASRSLGTSNGRNVETAG